jgi:hypothetical protein
LIDTWELPERGMMAKVSMHRGSGAKVTPQSSGQTFPKLLAFAKLLREHIGLWGGGADSTPTPRTDITKRFLKEFSDRAATQQAKVGTPTTKTFIHWWKGETRPHSKEFEVILLVLFGGDETNDRCVKLRKAWGEADRKAAGQQAKAAVKPPPAEEPDRPPPRYVSRPLVSKVVPSPMVSMAIHFVNLNQGSIEDESSVVLDLNWGYEDGFGVPCRLYMKEFHLFVEEENCAAVPGSFYEGDQAPGLEVCRLGRRWVFKAGQGHRLQGKFKEIDRLYAVKPTLDPGDPATVKVIARCPGTTGDFIEVDWLGQEPSDLTVEQQAVIGRFVARCQERVKTGGTAGAGEISIELGRAGISLVKDES